MDVINKQEIIAYVHGMNLWWMQIPSITVRGEHRGLLETEKPRKKSSKTAIKFHPKPK